MAKYAAWPMLWGPTRGIIPSDMEASIPTRPATVFAKMVENVKNSPLRRRMRVVVANEPRAYREVTAEVLRDLRPEVEFELTDPAGLQDAVSRQLTDMVVCDRATSAVRDGVEIWLELYPGGDSRSVASVRGERSTIEDVQLLDIVALVDRATERLPGREETS